VTMEPRRRHRRTKIMMGDDVNKTKMGCDDGWTGVGGLVDGFRFFFVMLYVISELIEFEFNQTVSFVCYKYF